MISPDSTDETIINSMIINSKTILNNIQISFTQTRKG